MRRLLLTALSFIFSFSIQAHNMNRDTKIKYIKKALHPLANEVSRNDIEITANPLSFNYSFQELRFDSGDHDIDHIKIRLLIKETPHEIECDMMTIEAEGNPFLYIMAFEDCTILNLENKSELEFEVKAINWNDFQY